MIAGPEGVHVVAEAGAHIVSAASSARPARAKSSAVVSFTLPASPSKVLTLMPAHSASAASSVKSSRPAARAR